MKHDTAAGIWSLRSPTSPTRDQPSLTRLVPFIVNMSLGSVAGLLMNLIISGIFFNSQLTDIVGYTFTFTDNALNLLM